MGKFNKIIIEYFVNFSMLSVPSIYLIIFGFIYLIIFGFLFIIMLEYTGYPTKYGKLKPRDRRPLDNPE